MSAPPEAIEALMNRVKPWKHGQLCPIWVGHKRKNPPAFTECDCWQLPDRTAEAEAVCDALTSLASADSAPAGEATPPVELGCDSCGSTPVVHIDRGGFRRCWQHGDGKCWWCHEPASGVSDSLLDGHPHASCLMPHCGGINPRRPAAPVSSASAEAARALLGVPRCTCTIQSGAVVWVGDCPRHPAPVSSGEAGTGEAVQS